MWWALFFGFIALMILVAMPLQTAGAVLGAVAGYYLGYTQIGEGAGVAGAILGFIGGIMIGSELRTTYLPDWQPSPGDAFALAGALCIAAIMLAGVFLVGTFIVQNWSVK